MQRLDLVASGNVVVPGRCVVDVIAVQTPACRVHVLRRALRAHAERTDVAEAVSRAPIAQLPARAAHAPPTRIQALGTAGTSRACRRAKGQYVTRVMEHDVARQAWCGLLVVVLEVSPVQLEVEASKRSGIQLVAQEAIHATGVHAPQVAGGLDGGHIDVALLRAARDAVDELAIHGLPGGAQVQQALRADTGDDVVEVHMPNVHAAGQAWRPGWAVDGAQVEGLARFRLDRETRIFRPGTDRIG